MAGRRRKGDGAFGWGFGRRRARYARASPTKRGVEVSDEADWARACVPEPFWSGERNERRSDSSFAPDVAMFGDACSRFRDGVASPFNSSESRLEQDREAVGVRCAARRMSSKRRPRFRDTTSPSRPHRPPLRARMSSEPRNRTDFCDARPHRCARAAARARACLARTKKPGLPAPIPPTVTYGPSDTDTGTGAFTPRPQHSETRPSRRSCASLRDLPTAV